MKIPEGVNRFTTGEFFVTLVAMEYAKRGRMPGRFAIDDAYDQAYGLDIPLSSWEAERLPTVVYSLMDADLYGYRGAFA
jgi:hypothetical protein